MCACLFVHSQKDVMIKHKYADNVPVRLHMCPGGTDDQRLFVAVMRRTGPSEGMAIFDHKVRAFVCVSSCIIVCVMISACLWHAPFTHDPLFAREYSTVDVLVYIGLQGRIEYVNNHFATMLGRQPEDMTSLEMHHIMPQPFGIMHPKWMKVCVCLCVVGVRVCVDHRHGCMCVRISVNGTPCRLLSISHCLSHTNTHTHTTKTHRIKSSAPQKHPPPVAVLVQCKHCWLQTEHTCMHG